MESKLLYHITNYRNLPSILEKKGLSAYSQVADDQIPYTDISHQSIQSRRSTTPILLPPNGMLHDYVPFYFAPRSPMLYAIKQGIVDGYTGTQNDIIYLVTRTDIIENAGNDYVFTNGHAIILWTEFYNKLSDLDQIDWEVMESNYWNDTDEHPDRKRKRQSEFLVHQFVDFSLLLGIGVRSEQMKNTVNQMLKEYHKETEVLIRPSFYY